MILDYTLERWYFIPAF